MRERWMRGSSSALRGVLLAMLLERPGHGPDLASRVAARLGDTWRIDPNDIYRLMEQLELSGLVEVRNKLWDGRRQGRRTRLVYYPTETTAEAFTAWLEADLPREPLRLGIQAKLSVARPQDARRLLDALRRHEAESLALISDLRPHGGEPASWAELCHACSREAVLAHLRAEIDWAASTRARIKKASETTT